MTNMKLAYAYHCLTPITGMEHLLNEHDHIAELWDDLVAIERESELRVEKAAAAFDQETRDAMTHLDYLFAKLKTSEDKKSVWAEINTTRKVVWAGIKKWRKEAKDESRAIETWRRQEIKKARQGTAAWWPNYNYAIQRFDSGRQVARQFGRRMRYHDDERDDGVLCLQIQRTGSGLGAAPAELFSGQVRMLSLTPVDFDGPKKSRYSEMRWRVDAGGNEIIVPVLLHRPFPDGCRIKGAVLSWRRVGHKMQWRVSFQLADVPTQEPVKHHTSGSVEFCWDYNPDDGLVVARPSWGDPLIIPTEWIRARENTAERHWRDLQKELKASGCGLTMRQAFTAKTENVGDWLNDWKRRYWLAERTRWKFQRRRKDLYRKWARDAVRECTDMELPDIRLDKVARTDDAGQQWRTWACINDLRSELVHQANKNGCRITANGKVLTAVDDGKSGAWERRKTAAAERSKPDAGSRVTSGVQR